ncbi:MAG: SGNH/GDSL hydrolase family protein [Lachnospiraceae bacterium]|nr:SGNH/GDSL hydrolase family protein [Lachnospiraceae bacterium]
MNEFIKAAGYFLLGVLATLCVMFIGKEINKEKNMQVNVAQESVVETEVLTVEETTEYDYEAEAEEKMKKLQEENKNAKQETTSEEESTVAVTPTVSANSIEAAKVKWKKDYPTNNAEKTLEENQNIRSSYEETLATNAFDKKMIDNSTIDFSDVKIAIIGDSITAGSNLSVDEQKQYAIPVQLQKILGAKEVYNLGIGGSTVSRVSDSYPMVDRWQNIPTDTDIIIVFGGTNDCLIENKWDYGFLEYDKRMTSGTFCGDLDEMLGGIKYTYREHNENSYIKFLIVNPPSTILQDAVYNRDPGNMVHQSAFAEAINEIAPAYGFEVIDMYDNNLFNSHDENVNKTWIYDGVHGNAEAYQMIAEHLASEIIQRIEQ